MLAWDEGLSRGVEHLGRWSYHTHNQTDSGNFRFNIAYALRNANYASDLGTTRAAAPFGAATAPITTNNLAFSAGWAFNPAATFNATYGVGFAQQFGSSNSAGIQTWSLGFTFPNLGGKGNSALVAIGQQPYVSGSSVAGQADAPGLTFETNYKFQVTDNIAIQPGIIIESGTNGRETTGANGVGGTTYVPYVVTTFSF